MIKLFGEPVAFDEEQPSKPVFAICLIAAIFLLFCLFRHLDLPGDPNVRHLHLWPAIVGLLGLGVGKNAALGNVVIACSLCSAVFRRCCG